MDLTLFLTEDCNLRCRYCYHNRAPRTMDDATLTAALRLGMADCGRTAVSFFGGEPLLCRERILAVLAACRRVHRETGHVFRFQMTTNGTLLDEPFLAAAREHSLLVALSYDGLAQDRNRPAASGDATGPLLREKIPLLLRYQPYAPVLLTVAPDCVDRLSESVRRLVEEDGFRYIVFNPAFGPDIPWTEADLAALAGQYRTLADLSLRWHRRGQKARLLPFAAKIDAYIRGEDVCAHTCTLGERRVSVAADGRLYPCVQFVGDPGFCIGDVVSGVDQAALARVRAGRTAPEACRSCALRTRCRHACGCLNKLTSGDPNTPGGVLCAHERLLIETADRLAARLYRSRDRRFLRRHYDRTDPLRSLLEDLR